MVPPIPPKPPSGPTMSTRAPTAAPTRRGNGESLAPKGPGTSHLVEPAQTAPNRKKQKRRQKQAARPPSEQQTHNGCMCAHTTDHNTLNSTHPDMDETHSHDDPDYDSADAYYDDHESLDAHHDLPIPPMPGEHEQHAAAARKAKKKKGRMSRADSNTIPNGSSTSLSTHSTSMTHPFPPTLPPHVGPRAILKSTKDRSIWNTSTQEERENIKAFWLELGEDERRQLVKVEKDAVLKKMKEQQKHSCSCTVCGRKRTAIEEELEVLYDAYYEELEQYANTNQDSFDPNAPIVPPPRLYQSPLRAPGQHTRTQGQFHPPRGRVEELPEDDGPLEEEEDDEEEAEDEDDEDEDDSDVSYVDEEEFINEETHAPRADFFAFGNSLTVKDGILTVADDLLKNDGKHFIDMMEQLAERRMQREEDTQYGIAAAHQSLHDGHNHGPLDEEEYDDEEDEEYDSQEEEDYDEEDMDAMTEEQRMEEGRRMFQIFAARMFEQRVLTAYRERVAERRQQKLIQELMEEETRNEQRSAKKAREAQKKKDKKRLQRQAKEEEKARREAEKAAEEAAAKAQQEKKLEEQRRKREEQRKKREAERKSQEEERARKEAEKQRRLREERDRQAEMERKQREQKEQEKRKKEEAQQREQEEREVRAVQEKKIKDERARRVKEEQVKREKEARPSQDAKGLHDNRRHIQGKRTSPSGPTPVPPSSSSSSSSSTSAPFTSPRHLLATTPILRKSSTPTTRRQSSHQTSHSSSPMSHPVSGDQLPQSPGSMPLSQSSAASSGASKQGPGQQPPPLLHHPQPFPHVDSANTPHPPGFANVAGLPTHHPNVPGMGVRFPTGPELPVYPTQPGPPMNQGRGISGPSGIPPGFHDPRTMPPARGFPYDLGHLGHFLGQQSMPSPFSPPQQGAISQALARHLPSLDFSTPESYTQPKPIMPPPSITAQDHNKYRLQREIEDLRARFGSSALLEDADRQSAPKSRTPGTFPAPAPAPADTRSSASELPTNPTNEQKKPAPPVGTSAETDPFGSQAFGGSPFVPTWRPPPGGSWSTPSFDTGTHNLALDTFPSRPDEVREYVIKACAELNRGQYEYHDVERIVWRMNRLLPLWEVSFSTDEILDIVDKDGVPQSDDGSFSLIVRNDRKYVKHEPNPNKPAPAAHGSNFGEIGSALPATTSATSSTFRRYLPSPPPGFWDV